MQLDKFDDPESVDAELVGNVGEVIPDPWDDPNQTDWPNANEEVAE